MMTASADREIRRDIVCVLDAMNTVEVVRRLSQSRVMMTSVVTAAERDVTQGHQTSSSIARRPRILHTSTEHTA